LRPTGPDGGPGGPGGGFPGGGFRFQVGLQASNEAATATSCTLPSPFAVYVHHSILVQHYVSHTFVQFKWKLSRQKTVTQPVCLQSSGDPFEMFNTFFGGGGMGGGGGGGGQQKFKMNMGGGGMGGGGMGGGGIEELLMGGMYNCHATRMPVVSMPLAS